jgi:hypothetical protein
MAYAQWRSWAGLKISKKNEMFYSEVKITALLILKI